MNIANHRRPNIKKELEIVKMLWPDPNSSAYETFEKCSILFEYKEGEN
jgi:hypothetical protein